MNPGFAEPLLLTTSHRVIQWSRWALPCTLLLGVLLRLYHYLAVPSFWGDEAALSLNIIERGYAQLIGPLDHAQAAPPFYLWDLRSLYALFGCNEWSMRLPSLVGGVLMMLMAWPWGKQNLGPAGVVCLLAFAATSMHGLEHTVQVKPYTLDAMWTVLIFYVGQQTLHENNSGRGLAMLLVLALLGPWVSYPATFSLIGVGVTFAIASCRRRERRLVLGLLAYGLLGVCSCGLFWLLVGRHQHTSALTDYWKFAFWDASSPLAAITWPVVCLCNMANHATTSLGIPFLVLAPIGLWSLARRCWMAVMMMAGMFGAALLANALGKYPLEGRLTYFMGPVLWLLVAASFDAGYELIRPRWRWLLVPVFLGLSCSDLIRTCTSVLHVESNGEWRGAYEYVHQHWQDGDCVWSCENSVYRIYYGDDRWRRETCRSLKEAIAKTRHRLWIVTVTKQPPEMAEGLSIPQWEESLAASGWKKIDENYLHLVEVHLLLPPAGTDHLGSPALQLPREVVWLMVGQNKEAKCRFPPGVR